MAINLIAATREIEDIDQMLHALPALCDEMTDQCGDILQAAHYDKSEYSAWAASKNWKPKQGGQVAPS